MNFKGKVQTNFKSTHKVWKNVKKTAICQNIIAESWGGNPPQMQYFDMLQFLFSHFVHNLCVLLKFVWTFPLKFTALLRWKAWFFNDFACFFGYFPSLCSYFEKSWKSKIFKNLRNRGFLGPCPDDRAQTSVQDSLNESSVRPNPTLVFIRILFKICHFWAPPVPPQKNTKIHPSPDEPP